MYIYKVLKDAFISSHCLCAHVYTAMVCMWKSEVSLQESALSFHVVGPRDQPRVIRQCSKHLGHLTGSVSKSDVWIEASQGDAP